MNGDGIVDTFWIIYAGVGQEAGGGALGEFALWSHSSDVRYYFGGWDSGLRWRQCRSDRMIFMSVRIPCSLKQPMWVS